MRISGRDSSPSRNDRTSLRYAQSSSPPTTRPLIFKSEPPTHSTTITPNLGAQFGEDQRLGEIFSKQPHGVCLEVGAFDGLVGSATYAFEQIGWTCILVEPIPEMVARIRSRRVAHVVEAAAGPTNATVSFKRARHDAAISSLADCEWQQNLYSLRRESWDEITVQQRTLDDILSEAAVARVDFATIDVEGYELPVLQGGNIDRWRPRVIILEDNSRGVDLRVSTHLKRLGYVCFEHTGVNDWYARIDDSELASMFACWRQRAWRGWRRTRARIRPYVPGAIRGVLRKLKLAGE